MISQPIYCLPLVAIAGAAVWLLASFASGRGYYRYYDKTTVPGIMISLGLLAVAWTAFCWVTSNKLPSNAVAADEAPKRGRPKAAEEEGPPVAVQKPEPPRDGVLYVWPVPVGGYQSLVVLGVVDGNTVDAAYLVPVRIKLRGAVSPPLDARGGKAAQASLEKIIAGQLRTVQLWGPDPAGGGIIADFWIPPNKDDKPGRKGTKGHWASELMIRQGATAPKTSEKK